MLLNGILFNSESWYDLKEEEIESLNAIDQYLLRKILNLQSKMPVEALYLETGSIPIKYCIKKRRLMYLHHILNRSDDELIKRFYLAQKSNPSKNDWTETVKNDLKELNIDMQEEKIQKMKKYNFKKVVKEKIAVEAFNYLMKKKETHSKLDNIHYEKLQT